MTTPDGRQWQLDSGPATDIDVGKGEGESASRTRLVLSHVQADRTQAEVIARWLRSQGLQVELALDSDAATPVGDTESGRVIRLWTHAARRYWSSRDVEQRGTA